MPVLRGLNAVAAGIASNEAAAAKSSLFAMCLKFVFMFEKVVFQERHACRS
jgi:hypothetical protein